MCRCNSVAAWSRRTICCHADANGVTLIPHAIASEIADAAPQYLAAEQIVLDALRQEELTSAQLGEARRAMGANIAELSARLRR